MKNKFTIGAFAIITNKQDEVLLCHRTDYDLRNLPGGGVKKGETPWECVIREVKEETGLIVKVSRLIGVYSKPNKDDVVFMFVCKIFKGELTLNSEARDLKYFSLNNIPENTIPRHIERIKDYFKDKSKIYLKKQTGKSVKEMKKFNI